MIAGAGHHLYADKPKMFNQIVNEVCKLTDENKLSHTQTASLEKTQTEDINSTSTKASKDADDKSMPVST